MRIILNRNSEGVMYRVAYLLHIHDKTLLYLAICHLLITVSTFHDI